MAETRLSDTFKLNFFFWKILGLWPGRTSTKYYNYYSFSYLFVTFFVYNILLTLNLIYTPRTMELLIREVIFYFTEVAVAGKVLMILFKRKQILESFDLLDSEFFKGEDSPTEKIVQEGVRKYTTFWKHFAILCNVAYSLQVVLPLVLCMIFGNRLELPICKYYFLSDTVREKYFIYLFIYQSVGMYGHMTYNVNIVSFIGGLIWMAITQLNLISHKITNIRLGTLDFKEPLEIQERRMITKLKQCLRHYDLVLEYYTSIQEVMSVTMFVQFGMAAAIICVILCGLTVASSTETLLFLGCYLCAVTCQIFVPGWLGTELTCKNQELVFAAYSSEWLTRSEKFKRSLRLFVERANTPIVLKGLKMFPLALGTFLSIMKTGYSLFALVRNVQDRQNNPAYGGLERETGLSDGSVPLAASMPLPSARHRAPQSLTLLQRTGRPLQNPSSPIHPQTQTQTQSDLANRSLARLVTVRSNWKQNGRETGLEK